MAKGTKHIGHGVKVDDDAQVFIKCQPAVPDNSDLATNEVVIYLDEGADELKFKAKYSNGNVSIGTLSIS